MVEENCVERSAQDKAVIFPDESSSGASPAASPTLINSIETDPTSGFPLPLQARARAADVSGRRAATSASRMAMSSICIEASAPPLNGRSRSAPLAVPPSWKAGRGGIAVAAARARAGDVVPPLAVDGAATRLPAPGALAETAGGAAE